MKHYRRDGCGISQRPDQFHQWRMEAIFQRYERRRRWRLVRVQEDFARFAEWYVELPFRLIRKLRGEG